MLYRKKERKIRLRIYLGYNLFMGFFSNFLNLYKKNSGTNAGGISSKNIFRMFSQGIINNVGASKAYSIYNKTSAVGDAVDMIATRFSDITPVILTDKNEPVENETVQTSLKQPNSLESYREFAINVSTNFLLDNNCYLQVLGNIKSKPIGIYNIPNDQVSFEEKENNACLSVNTTGLWEFLKDIFYLNMKEGRFFSKSNLKEMYIIKGFNQTLNRFTGVNKLSSVFQDTEVIQKSLGSQVSNLKGGFNSSNLISVDTDDQEAIEQFKKDIQTNQSGPNNNGKALIVRGKTVDIKKIEQSNKDMQHVENKKDSRLSIFSRFQIPAPMVDQSSQTYDNYHTALISLYDNAVLPLADVIFEKITKIFQDRGLLQKNERITYDKKSINALQSRMIKDVQEISKAQILTTNELRNSIGYKSLSEGGDFLYMSSTLTPIAKDEDLEEGKSLAKKAEFFTSCENESIEREIIEDAWNQYKKLTD